MVGLFGGGFWWWADHRKGIIDMPSHTHGTLVPQLYQSHDRDAKLPFEKVRRLPRQRWQQVQAVNFGYRGGKGWAYASIHSKDSLARLLEIQSHFIDSVKIWLVSGGGSVREYPITGFRHLSQNIKNPLLHRYLTFELPLDIGHTYQLFIRSSTAPGIPVKYDVKLWSPIEFRHYLRVSDGVWAIFAGIVISVIFISLFCYFFHRKLIYLYYAGYVAALSLYGVLNDGWGIFLPFQLHQHLNPIFIGHLLNLSLCFFLLFSRRFLVISSQSPQWWLRVSPWWFWLLISACILIAHNGYSLHDGTLIRLGYSLGISISVAAGLVWLAYLIDALNRGFRPAWLLFVSQLVLILFYGINIFLVNMNALTLAYPDMYIFRLALIIELMVIAAGWIYRQKVINESQEQLQAINVAQRQTVQETERRLQDKEIRALRLENELYGQRDRLARDLHDGIGSQLSHIISRLDLLSMSPVLPGELTRLSDFTRETNRNLRETIWILNREYIPFDDFAARLHGFLRTVWEDRETPSLIWQPKNASSNPALPPLVVLHLLRITQEATANALKYAKATEITVHLEAHGHELVLTILDNGRGICPDTASPGLGLSNIRWRAEEMGGGFGLDTSESGTSIRVTIPLI